MKNMVNAFTLILFSLISFFPFPFLSAHVLQVDIFLFIFLAILCADKERIKDLFSKHDCWLWLFLASMFAGTINATQKQIAFKAYSHLFITFALLFYIGKGILRKPKDANFLMILISCVSCIIVMIGFSEMFMGKNILYEKLFTHNPYYERYVKFGHRILSTQYNPVVLGSYLLFCLPFNFALSKHGSFPLKRLGIFSSIACIIAALLTFSRGVFLGLIVLLFFYFWKARRKKILALIIICVTVLILSASLQRREPLCRFGIFRLFSGTYDSIFSEYRMARVNMTARIFKEHPFVGIGLQHFRIRFVEFCELADKKTPHEFMIPDNMYLTFLAETGVCGILGFLVFVFLLLKKGFYEFRNTSGLISALLGLLVNMGGYELFYWDNPLMLFALLCGFLAVDRSCYQSHQEG
ncbi:MAG: O-antigen ligase family protein [Candidatus Omnitrophica bacterium]|nr:O-antigen ligase family protein [Candidatus Omnitrophota bacterium]